MPINRKHREGKVEVDEIYEGGKNKNRHANKKLRTRKSEAQKIKSRLSFFRTMCTVKYIFVVDNTEA